MPTPSSFTQRAREKASTFLKKRESSHLATEGIKLGTDGRYSEAIDKLEKALELDSDNTRLHYWLGMSYYGNEHCEKAREQFELAIRFFRDDFKSYFSLASCFFYLGTYWKTVVYDLAYLDFKTGGERTRLANDMLKALALDPYALDCNEEEWLDSAKAKYEELKQSMAKQGKELGQTISASEKRDNDVLSDELKDYVNETFPFMTQRWGFAHFNNADKLLRKRMLRAGIAQLTSGLEILPYDQDALLFLAMAYNDVGERQRAARIAGLIDLERLRSENRLRAEAFLKSNES